jgi:hypothetical protein
MSGEAAKTIMKGIADALTESGNEPRRPPFRS